MSTAPQPTAATTSSSSASQAEHILKLKVMRLSRPSLSKSSPIFMEERTQEVVLKESRAALAEHLHFGSFDCRWGGFDSDTSQISPALGENEGSLGSMVVLPSSFGNIYLGDTFSSYLCINNESNSTAGDVIFRAELQTATRRSTLRETRPHNLLGSQTVELVLTHDIRELGMHLLICTVQYMLGRVEKRIRKVYKFNVLNPIAVKSKVTTLLDGKRFAVEAQIQNISVLPMFLEHVLFSPVPDLYTVGEDINSPSNTVTNDVMGDPYLNVGEVRQFLFIVSGVYGESKWRDVTALGNLDISWRTSMGEKGQIQTTQLIRNTVSEELVVLELLKTFSEPVLEIPVVLEFVVKNMSDKPMTLLLNVKQDKLNSQLAVLGTHSKSLGTLQPGSSTTFQLTVLPLVAGVVAIEGLSIRDEKSQFIRECDGSHRIFVRRKSSGPAFTSAPVGLIPEMNAVPPIQSL